MLKRRFVWVFWLVAVLAVATSAASYAWVAMNISAGVRVFDVEAFSDSVYLQISGSPDDGFDKNVSFSRRLLNNLFDESERVSLVAYGKVPDEGAMIIEPILITEENADTYGDSLGRFEGGSRRFYSADASDITDGDNNYIDVTDALKLKDPLIGYYVIEEVAVHENAETSDSYYYVKTERDAINRDYSCLGSFSVGERLSGRLYWGYSESDREEDAGANNALNVVSIDTPTEEYSYKKTVYLRCAENTVDATNLRISEVGISGRRNGLTDSLRVMFVAYGAGDTVITFYSHRDKEDFDGSLFDSLAGNAAEVVTVDIYIFFDGTDKDARNTAEIINSHTVSVTFAFDGHEYN